MSRSEERKNDMAGGYFGGRDRDPTGRIGSDKDRNKGKADSTGGGTGALTGAQSASARGYQAPGSAKAADKAWQGAGNRVVNGRAEGGAGSLGGGTTTTMQQTPGAVPNFPDADGLTVVEKVLGPLVPGVGSMLGVATVGKMLDEDSTGPTTVFGGDPGPQRGFQPDRFKGKANLTGVGDPGSASGLSADERSIPGRGYSSGVAALVGDSETPNPYLPAEFSDVTLQDRRKPRLTAAQAAMTLMSSF